MTDDKRKSSLSKEQEDKAIKWLSDKCPTGVNTCEVCGTASWMVLGDIVAPMNLKDGGIALGGSITPQFMTMCRNCGNTKYFNAIISGVLETKKEGEDGKTS